VSDVLAPIDPQSRKASIREQARKNRIAQKNKDGVSQTICAKFMGLPSYAAATTVMWYVDAGSEVRTRHALPVALCHRKRLVVPWCLVETNQLELFLLEDVSELVEGAYKILEPKAELRDLPAKKIQPEELDLVMVPGTAFDSRGARMGQGKGYYDRLLARARRDAPLVGMAFDCQIFDEIPVAPHDVFMDVVLTESRELPGLGRKW
jgi:5-formyltetrahydrofolate cyclo-ligase